MGKKSGGYTLSSHLYGGVEEWRYTLSSHLYGGVEGGGTLFSKVHVVLTVVIVQFSSTVIAIVYIVDSEIPWSN